MDEIKEYQQYIGDAADSDGSDRDNGGITAGEVTVRLEAFEGPFDLLLTLINKKNIEITDVSISEVTDTYLDIVFCDGNFNVELASEYLVIAARLVYLKTRRLLPRSDSEEETEMTEEDLAEHVRIYEIYKNAAEDLGDRYLFWQDSLTRGREIIDFPAIEEEIELDEKALLAGYERARLRSESLNRDNAERMKVILTTEKVSIKEKIGRIVSSLKEKVRVKFSELFNRDKNSVPEIVTGFLALLELGKQDAVKISQDEVFGEIVIQRKKKNLDDLDINMEDYNEWDDT